MTLILRDAQVVTPDGIRPADVAVEDSRIAAIGPGLSGRFDEEINLHGQFLFPGVVDAHVHFNEPGREDWEGLATGSRAFAAGGGAVFFDMPLNSEPPATTAEAFLEKRRRAERLSVTDFALWGGLVPGNEDRLRALREAGAIGLKAFMCPSGIDSFPAIDGEPLRRGMRRAAELGLPVAVHAEDAAITERLTQEARRRGETGVRAYLQSRPVEAETAAIRRAAEFAGETRCRLQIVHVSSPEGLAAAAEAKARGVDITVETCPHYLLLTDADMEQLGAPAKCAPPLRDSARLRGLWDALRGGGIDTIGSDHSPAPASLKQGSDFFAVWGGIAGIQHGIALLLSETVPSQTRDWPVLARMLSEAPARRFRLPARKGRLVPGADADFFAVSVGAPEPIRAEDLLTRHRISPYVSRPTRVRITRTWVRGRTPSAGQFLRPDASAG